MAKKTIFCAHEQKETPHTLSASEYSGEIQAICDNCGRLLKFPAGISREAFDALVAVHKEGNQGQVSQESIDKTLEALGD
jgi:hypothetical protein